MMKTTPKLIQLTLVVFMVECFLQASNMLVEIIFNEYRSQYYDDSEVALEIWNAKTMPTKKYLAYSK